MKKKFLSFALGCTLTASVFIFNACNSKDELKPTSDPVNVNYPADLYDMGGTLTGFSKTVELINGNKTHTEKIGDQYIKYEAFDKNLVDEVLKQEGCEAIRIYYGYDLKAKQKQLIIVGVDKDGNDIVKPNLNKDVATFGITCPKVCN